MITSDAVARVLGITTSFKNLRKSGSALVLPQRIAVFAQGNSASTYPATKFEATSAAHVAGVMGFGSPAHHILKQLRPTNGDGVGSIPITVYPLADHGSGVVAEGAITPVGTPSKQIVIRAVVGGVRSEAIVLAKDATVAQAVTAITEAINAVLDMPVLATDSTTVCDLDAKWKGATGNDITLAIEGDTSSGMTFGTTAMASGDVNPTVDAALAQVGNVWETMVINGLNVADTTALDAYSTFGEGRWGTLVRKPLVVFTGNTAATVANATTQSSARTTDKTNSQLVAPGSPDMPFVVAARQVARIAVVAATNPPTGYGALRATGISPGTDGEQWDDPSRNSAIKKGSSTVEVVNGEVVIGNVVTFYAPVGDPEPAYRHVVDIVKLQNIIFNLDVVFAAPEWAAAPVVPDDQPVVNPKARKPKAFVAAARGVLEQLGLSAIIADTKAAKDSVEAGIDGGNSKRVNLSMTVALSGNTHVKDVDLNFGFFYGTPALAA